MFDLDPTLKKDSHPIAETDRLLIRLIDDARFPWVVIVPKAENAVELFDLDPDSLQELVETVNRIGRGMKTALGAEKINTAAIGNIVRQLHIHIVARQTDDAAWPGPVWGNGAMVPLDDEQRTARTEMIRALF